ncbi:MAG: type IV pilus biogenesis/stability protein PilW [Woeseiaceae bacterium]|nr:type IV pilus biogenesis/stability protein PilW [Woeseiaceae bacterium]
MTRAKILVLAAVFCVLAGCVSSTTQVRRSPADTDDAASQNYQLGARYFRNGNYDLARDRLMRAIELDPRMASAHSMLALTYVQLGNTRLATESFDRAIRYGPNDQDVRNAYAVFLCRQKNFEDARKQFDRAIDIHENDNPEIMMTNAGVCMSQKPDLELAEKYFRQALERRATYGEALIQMAALKHRTGDNFNASAFLQRYLASNEASAAVLYLGIQVETANGNDRAATDYLNRLLREFPDSAEARQTLQTKNR